MVGRWVKIGDGVVGFGQWVSGFRGCESVGCGLWVGSGGLLIRGLP